MVAGKALAERTALITSGQWEDDCLYNWHQDASWSRKPKGHEQQAMGIKIQRIIQEFGAEGMGRKREEGRGGKIV